MAEYNFVEGDEQWHRLRRKCQTDLWFLNQVLGHDAIPLTYETHWAAFQFAARNTGIPEIDHARVQRILVFREFGKSTGITKTRTLQHILRDPNHCVGIANETLLMAKGFLGGIKAVFEQNDLIRRLFPDIVPADFHKTIWAADMIKVNRTVNRVEPTILAVGVDRSVTGVHMSEWILDDLMSNEAAENARSGSFSEFRKIEFWLNRLEPLCDGSDTPITMIGTPWWQGDCYDYAESIWGFDEPIREVKWNCELPDGRRQIHILELQGEMATFKRPVLESGKSVFPEKWSMERIDRMRRKDPQLFSANLMINPSSDIVRDFKDSWLKYYEWTVPGKEVRYRDNNGEWRTVRTHEFDTVMAVDPAISEAARADRSAIIVSGSIDGIHHLILDVRAERLGVLDLCTFIEELQRQHRCRRIYVESVAYQRALSQLLASKGLPIIEVKPGSNKTKEMRIRSLEPYFRQGHIYVHQRQHEFFTEYEHFPRGQHDDVLDAMSYLTDEWSKIIGRNPRTDQIRKEHDRQQLEKLKNWGRPRREARTQTRTEVGPAPKHRG